MYLSVLLCFFACALVYGQEQGVPRCYLKNEEYTDCGSACPTTCDSLLATDSIGCAALCVPGCFCKQGYVRNRWGNCIPQDKCPCHRPNEIFTCGSACQTTCETLNQDCPIKNIRCSTTCYCKDDYARDQSGVCIPVHECLGYNEARK